MAHQLRMMAVSATVPNFDDVAEWLNGKGNQEQNSLNVVHA